MKLHDPHALRHLPAEHPAPLERLAKIIAADAARLSLPSPPPAVAQAQQQLADALALPGRLREAKEQAEAAQQTKARSAVSKLAEALAHGDFSGAAAAFKTPAAGPPSDAAYQSAEAVLLDAHERLVDAVHAAWAEWRRQLVDSAAEAHATAAEAVQTAAGEIATARDRYAAVTRIDHEMLTRHPQERAAAEAELVGGLHIFEATHAGQAPLTSMPVPGAKTRAGEKPPRTALATVVEAVVDAVGKPADFAGAAWAPPGDPRHDEMLATPLPADAPWVRSQLLREQANICAVCGIPGPVAQLVVAELDDGSLALVHARCRDRKPTAADRRRAEREARMMREGFPTPPGLEDSPHQRELEQRARDNAYADAISGPPDV